MFLRPLNNEQKSMFLSLATYAAKANGIVEESEKFLLNAYAEEMGIDITSSSSLTFDEILKELKKISTKKELNQIMFEIVGMMVSDAEFDDEEKTFLQKLSNEFEITKEKVDKMLSYINKYTNIIKEINILLFD